MTLLASCKSNSFDNGCDSASRDKVVVISDLHLSGDIACTRTLEHLPRLVEFLKEVRKSQTVKEIVIAGDLFDEWYVPTRQENGDTQTAMLGRIAESNKAVFKALNAIIKEGKIKVTYIPGCSDMSADVAAVESVLPGIVQARDNGTMLGSYSPEGLPEVVIEHGNRYDFYAAPMSSEATSETVPPAYFMARLMADSYSDSPSTPSEATVMPITVPGEKADTEQQARYAYYLGWYNHLTRKAYVKDSLNSKIINTATGNMSGVFAIADLIPMNNPDGNIEMNLYPTICNDSVWIKRQSDNGVSVKCSATDAATGSLNPDYIDRQAKIQYFKNDTQNARVVVFGHTHTPTIIKNFTNTQGRECIYANSGSWTDMPVRPGETAEQDACNMDFVIVTPSAGHDSINVELYQYVRGEHVVIDGAALAL